MTHIPLRADQLRCKGGRIITILPPHRRLDISQEDEVYIVDPPVRMRTVPGDPEVEASGLARYWRYHNRLEGDDAEYAPVPVEIIRAFVRMHGGVAEAGGEALAELKRAASLETDEPTMGAPIDSQPPAAVEAIPESPLPAARAADVAGGPAPSAAARALGQHDMGGTPGLQLDDLTTAVIDARKVVADFEGPLVWKAGWGKPRPDLPPEVAALWKRIARGSGLASRLVIVEHDRYAKHPLLAEAVRLRARLRQISDDALRERDAREDAETARRQQLNGVLVRA